jgi:hypothetical protein
VAITQHRILSAALLLPVILFAVVGSSFAAWRCQYDGIARAGCCCPKADPADDAEPDEPLPAPGATISSAPCCDLERTVISKSPVTPWAGNPALTAVLCAGEIAAILVAILPATAPTELETPPTERAGAGPPGGRSLLVHKQTFLI